MLLSAVLIVIQLVVNMVCMANDFVSMVLSAGITMFLCAPVYMLMVSRIGKRFVTLIYMTILGVIFPADGQLVFASLLCDADGLLGCMVGGSRLIRRHFQKTGVL